MHPVHLQNKPLDDGVLLASLEKLFEVMKEVIRDEAFINSQNKVKRNSHLKVFSVPTDELIEEMLACSE